MAEIERALEHYSLAPVAKALMGLRGVDVTTAFTIVAELVISPDSTRRLS